MMVIFYLLLMLRVGRCTDSVIFMTQTVDVGAEVKLTCAHHQKTLYTESLFWIRIVSGTFPEVLGSAYNFVYDDVKETRRITVKQKPGKFLLHISETQLSDTGVYYCITVKQLNMTFVTATFLTIKELDITAIIQESPSDPVGPGDSVTLQCSVLSDSGKKTCPGDHSLYWFRAGSHGSHPSVIYARGNGGDECERSPEARSPQRCFYSFSRNVSSSDAGTYYCAVATCGEIIFGNGTTVDTEAVNMWDLRRDTVLFLLCAALAISLIVIAFLIYTIKKNASVTLQTNAATANGDRQSQQTGDDSLTYCAPTLTKRKTGRAERSNGRPAEGETIYSDVRAFVIE